VSDAVIHLDPKDQGGNRNVQGEEYGGDRRGGVWGGAEGGSFPGGISP